MKFIKIKCDNRVIVEPLERMSLFKHCTGGFSCMEFGKFSKDIIPILYAHGIDLITYKEDAN